MPTVAIGSQRIADLTACPRECLRSVTADLQWARAAESRWGSCGIEVTDASQTLGYALIAPGRYVSDPAVWGGMVGAGMDKPSAILVGCWVGTDGRGLDVWRVLLEGLVARLAAVGDVSLDACATRVKPTCQRPSAIRLGRYGFSVVSGSMLTPVMRLPVDTTIPTRPPARVWRRLLSGIGRTDMPPAPAQRRTDTPGMGSD